ncbi:hypothetical protein V8E36_003027 [Tilletia maclaganii]
MEAFVDELNNLMKTPFLAWDHVERDVVLIRPWLLAVLGDSVMLAKLTSSMGAQANFPCRLCSWGGNTEFKHTAAGIEAALQDSLVLRVRSGRNWDASSRSLRRTMPRLSRRGGKTRAKDAATTEASTILLEENDKLKGKAPRAPGQARRRLPNAEVKQKVAELKGRLQSKHWMSPLHSVTAFGGPEYTALDMLHIASLGPGKYLASLTSKTLSADALDHLRVRLESLCTTAITDATQFPTASMVKRLNTLNGKQVKALAQLIPFALAPLCHDGMVEQSLLDAWVAYGHLSRLVHVEYIADRDSYLKDVEAHLHQLWLAIAELKPAWLTQKLKLHLFVHVKRQVELFGPLKNIVTERYESFNAVQRQAAVHTNRGACNTAHSDIIGSSSSPTAIDGKPLQRPLRSSVYTSFGISTFNSRFLSLLTPSSGRQARQHQGTASVLGSNGRYIWEPERGEARPAGPEIQQLLDEPKVKHLRAKWVAHDEEENKPGKVVKAAASTLKVAAPDFEEFKLDDEGEDLPGIPVDAPFSPCKTVISKAKDVCSIDDFVSIRAKSTGTRRNTEYGNTVGRITHILKCDDPDVAIVRVQLFKIKEKTSYVMAGIISNGHHAVFEAKLSEPPGYTPACMKRSRLNRDLQRSTDPAAAERTARLHCMRMQAQPDRRRTKYVLNELLHRSPDPAHASLAATSTQLIPTSLTDIVDKAMRGMPPPPAHGRRKKKKPRLEGRMQDADDAGGNEEEDDVFTDFTTDEE